MGKPKICDALPYIRSSSSKIDLDLIFTILYNAKNYDFSACKL